MFKEIGRCFKLILKAHDTNVEIITTGDFMHRFCGTLSLCKEVQKAATCIAKKAVDLDIVPGRSPISVAAAAIYMASQVKLMINSVNRFRHHAFFYFKHFKVIIKPYHYFPRHQMTKDRKKKLQILLG